MMHVASAWRQDRSFDFIKSEKPAHWDTSCHTSVCVAGGPGVPPLTKHTTGAAAACLTIPRALSAVGRHAAFSSLQLPGDGLRHYVPDPRVDKRALDRALATAAWQIVHVAGQHVA